MSISFAATAWSVANTTWNALGRGKGSGTAAGAESSPDESHNFEPVSFLMSIAMHPLCPEPDTKLMKDGHQLKAQPPSEYKLLNLLNVRSVYRRYNNDGRDDLRHIHRPLERFCEWYLLDKDEEMRAQAKVFLGCVQLGLMSLKKLYVHTNTADAGDKWITWIRTSMKQEPREVKPKRFGKDVKAMLNKSNLVTINDIFKKAFLKKGLRIPDGSEPIMKPPEKEEENSHEPSYELDYFKEEREGPAQAWSYELRSLNAIRDDRCNDFAEAVRKIVIY